MTRRLLTPFALLFAASPLGAAVLDVQATDVTTRAAAMVWVSDQVVTGATVNVFADAGGTVDLTGGLDIQVISEQFTPAHTLGIVKVDVRGLAPGTSYYVQTATTASGGTVLEPAGPPFLQVTTAAATTLADALAQSITNDLLAVPALAPDGVTAADGTLVLFDVPAVSPYPLSVFLGEGLFDNTLAVVDTNNFFDAAGMTVGLADDQLLTVSHYRGGLCTDLAEQQQQRSRRAPAQTEFPTITNYAVADACFFADLVCDDVIDALDLQTLLDSFRATQGECGFNPDVDVAPNGAVDVTDLQRLLNRFGDTAPF